jgi:hypothetical protein
MNTYPYVRVEHPDDGNSKFKIYISELLLDRYEYMPEAYVITRCVILPRLLIVAFFVAVGGFFLDIQSYEINTLTIKEILGLFFNKNQNSK